MRGVAHVDLGLAVDLGAGDFRRVDYAAHSRRMMDAIWDRDAVYDLWGVKGPYDNLVYSTAHIEARDLTFHTAYTLRGVAADDGWADVHQPAGRRRDGVGQRRGRCRRCRGCPGCR